MEGEHAPDIAAAVSRPDDPIEASWCGELRTGLSYARQFVLSGNLRDVFPVASRQHTVFCDLEKTLRILLQGMGFVSLVVHDPIRGLRVSGPQNPELERLLVQAGLKIGTAYTSPAALTLLIEQLQALHEIPLALMVDYAGATLAELGRDADSVLVAADRVIGTHPRQTSAHTQQEPIKSVLIWIDERSESIPSWYLAAEDRIRQVAVEKPALETRYRYAERLVGHFPRDRELTKSELASSIERFALTCEGEALTTMRSITKLAKADGFGIDAVNVAIRAYRTGQRRNHWNSPLLRARLANAREALTARVKGQDHAIDRTLDVLMRSVTGLSGAQSSGGLTRPRGVLFFAGPTGVGKTELAKAVTELLFGDEGACHRFDMSEFMAEESIARLIGKPNDRGGPAQTGALLRALGERPFSVFLFDEVEKAHPRILDAFLQVLDEGRITDASGATGYFSEALIIFTSNIGMFGGARSMNMGMNILPSDPYDALDRKIHDAVQNHFRYDLQRPELINRLGQNVVSFDFIHPAAEQAIFEATLKRVCDRVLDEHGLEITLSPQASAALRDICTHEVFDGGRGIGNRVETHFVNPLARLIFEDPERPSLHIDQVDTNGGRTHLRVH